ncbi:alpha/beta hydrolase [Streptomyces sp. LZ34]
MPFGNSSLLLEGGLARHHGLLEPCPGDRLMIAGSEAESIYFSREAIEKAAEPKELVVIDGATHIDLYDKDEYVNAVVAELTEFFGKHLAG